MSVCIASSPGSRLCVHIFIQCYCVLSQAGQSAIIDAVWTEVLLQLLVASGDLRNKVLYTLWSRIILSQNTCQCLYSMMCIFSQDGWSALMEAAYDGHTEGVTQLLKAGANIELQSTEVHNTCTVCCMCGVL